MNSVAAPAPEARRVVTSTAVTAAARVAMLALGLASVAIATRYLGPAAYGRFSLALTLTGLVAVLADAGLTTILVRELAQRPQDAPRLIGSVFAVRGLLAALALAFAVIAALLLPYPDQVRTAVLIAGVPMTLGLLNSALVAVAQAGLHAGRIAIADLAGRGAALAALGAVAALDLGFYATVATVAVGAAVTLGVSVTAIRPLLPGRPVADRAQARALLLAALPLGLVLAVNEAYFRVDALIISLARPFEELGLYAIAWRTSELTALMAGAFLVSIFPLLARYAGDGDARLGPALTTGVQALAILGLGVFAGGAVIASELARLLGGTEFAGAADPLRILLAAAGLGLVSGLLGHALVAARHQKLLLWLSLAALTANAALNALLVPELGIEAAAWVTLGCEAGLVTASAWLVSQRLQVTPWPAGLARAAGAAAVMAGALWPLRDSPVWLTVPLGAGIYAGGLRVTGLLTRARLRELGL